MNKTLYFEGAGCEWTKRNDVENCRIRTAFANNDGKRIYLEIDAGIPNKYNDNTINLFCDFCHYITDDVNIDDCNNSKVKYNNKSVERQIYNIEYTKANILKFVNKYCGCDFDNVVILGWLSGYKVFNDNGKKETFSGYNFIEDFIYNPELEQKMIEKKQRLSNEFKIAFNQKYDNTSIYREGNTNILNVCINVTEQQRIAAGYTSRHYQYEIK